LNKSRTDALALYMWTNEDLATSQNSKEEYVVYDIASYSVFSTVYVQLLNRSIRRYLKIAPFSYENVINS
jgi:hypothetical protein